MNEKLLNCPFCGSADISQGEIAGQHVDGRYFVQSQCMTCGAAGPEAIQGELSDIEADGLAAEFWNRRAPDPERQAAVVAWEFRACDYDRLPVEIDRKFGLSNNGCGKEYAQYLLVYKNGNLHSCHSDAMEPEDARFSRDLDWVQQLLTEVVASIAPHSAPGGFVLSGDSDEDIAMGGST